MGQFDESIDQARTAVSLDPVSAHPHYVLGTVLACAHRYDEAIAELRKALELSSEFFYARFELAGVYIAKADYAAAEQEARSGAIQAGEDPALVTTLIQAVADPSLRQKAEQLLDRGGVAGHYELYGVADAFWYSLLGVHDKAISSLRHWVDRAPQEELFEALQFLWLPAFDPIRRDLRFKAVLEKMGLPYVPQDTTAQ